MLKQLVLACLIASGSILYIAQNDSWIKEHVLHLFIQEFERSLACRMSCRLEKFSFLGSIELSHMQVVPREGTGWSWHADRFTLEATDVIDAGFYLTQAYQDWFGSHAKEAYEEERAHRILLVDDSPFFRNLLTPLLSVAGYDVTTVENADEALTICEQGGDFDVIISDIEMPGMSGFEFAQAVRKTERWKEMPLIALSSFASPRDLDRGRQAGFNDYVAKFDRDALLYTLSQTLSDQRGAA